MYVDYRPIPEAASLLITYAHHVLLHNRMKREQGLSQNLIYITTIPKVSFTPNTHTHFQLCYIEKGSSQSHKIKSEP